MSNVSGSGSGSAASWPVERGGKPFLDWTSMLPHSRLVALYLVGGFVFGLALEPVMRGKSDLETPALAAIGLAAVLLMLWNVVMYRRASRDPDPEFPTSPVERYLPAVSATLSFLLGMGLVFFR